MSSQEGLSFLQARSAGRMSKNTLGMLDMLGRQAPAPDPVPTPVPADGGAVAATAPPLPAVRPQHRIMLSWGPDPGSLVIGLETGPDWDIEDSWQISRSAAREVLPILNALTKVKDLTGELKRALGPQAIPAKSKDAPANPRPARQQAPRQPSNPRGGRKNRAASPAVGGGGATGGPTGSRQGEALVRRTETSVPEAGESGE